MSIIELPTLLSIAPTVLIAALIVASIGVGEPSTELVDAARRRVTFYPIINYTTPDRRTVRFRSRTGSTHEELILAGPNVSPWRDGQSIEIFHDPSGMMEPCIASLWSLYGGEFRISRWRYFVVDGRR